MNTNIKKGIAVFLFIMILAIFLRLLQIPMYIFEKTKWEAVVMIVLLIAMVLSVFVTYKIVKIIYKNLD
jgi:hypothetical protein